MRRVAVAAAVMAALVLPACTPAQVKAWFWVNRHQRITNTQARNIAALTNRPPAPAPAPSPTCDPNYTGACVPTGTSDVDCAGGSGDGPSYVAGPVQVVGTDVYGLDSDNDGVGCES